MSTTVLTLVAVALALVTSLGAKEVCAAARPYVQLHATEQEMTEQGTRAPGDLCEACNGGYYWTVDQWFTGNETYAALCEPCRCPSCQGGWKPRAVTMYLFWENENSCALSVSARILAVDQSQPDCPRPSEVLCASMPTTVGPFSPAGLWAVTVPLPGDAPVITGPFFASLQFHSTCDELPAVVATRASCGPCASWNNWGQGWQELCGFGLPGNLTLYATLECQGPSPVTPATWTTIKSMYR
ncbi:MAG: hypothetical protein FJY74_05395 [Candidatus Eisenbacteria bacterium]|nr:hypothetical protein [Candidatus Eisenbacteria bacterium]